MHPSRTTILRAAFAALLLCASAAASARAGETGQGEGGGETYVDLPTAISIGLQNNLGLSIRQLEKKSAEEDVQIARAPFDPVLSGAAARNSDVIASNIATGEVTGYSAVISQKVSTGAVVELSMNISRTTGVVGSPDGFAQSDTRLSIRQPLLRGSGISANRAPIVLGQLAVGSAEFETRRSVLDLLRDIEIAYWEVVFAYRDKDVRERVVAVADRLLAETKGRGRVGLTTGVEPLQARALVASRQEDVIIAQQVIEDRTDRLTLLLGKFGRQRFRVRPDARIPRVPNPSTNEDRVVAMMEALPELQQRDNFVRARQVSVDRARSDARPILDLTAGTGYRGFGTSYGNSFNDSFREPNRDVRVLLEMRFPLPLREERATLRKRQTELQIEVLRKREVEQNLRAQIREATRAVLAGNARVSVTENSLQLSNEQFEQLTAKFQEGLTTFREMILVQGDLQDAGLRAERARLDAVEAGIRLARFDGTLLARYGLSWDSPLASTNKGK